MMTTSARRIAFILAEVHKLYQNDLHKADPTLSLKDSPRCLPPNPDMSPTSVRLRSVSSITRVGIGGQNILAIPIFRINESNKAIHRSRTPFMRVC